MLESIKQNASEEDLKKLYNIDTESNHIIVNELCEYIYNFGP